MHTSSTHRSVTTGHWLCLLGSFLTLLSLTACKAKSPAECAPLSAPVAPAVPDPAGRAVAEPTDKIAFIYDQSVLRTFELKLSEADLAILDGNPAAEKYVPGKLVFEGKEYGPVGIRYKGSLGSWVFCVADSTMENPTQITGAKTCPKLNMKVSFNEYDPNGRFFGVKKLLFHAMNSDSSLMRERLGYWLFRQMGVPAPRAVHTRLLINGKYQGVFINVEEIDSRFTRSHFADGEGNLYKEVWPTSLDGLTKPATAERWKSGLQTNTESNPSIDKALEFGRAVMQEGGDARAAATQSWLSTPNILRLIAVDRTIRNDDGPFHFFCDESGCENHNFYLYEEQKADRMWLIPWDLDLAFVAAGNLETGRDRFLQVANEWDDHAAVCERRNGSESWIQPQLPPSCDPLLNGLGCYFQDEYQRALDELLTGPFSASVVEQKVSAWQAQISTAVSDANTADPRQLSPTDWAAALRDLRLRIEFLRNQASSGRAH